MTTSSEHLDQSAQGEPAGTSLLSDQARATVEEIKAENAALEKADQVAEAQAQAMTEQAKQLAEVTEEVLEELKESKEGADPR
jgi:hypothetical protein